MNPTRIKLRYDTLTNWTTGSPLPTLAKGEVGIANDQKSIIAKIGTSETPQTWEQASFLSVQEDSSTGVNIESVGRVILEMYIGNDIANELQFTECITRVKFNDPSNTSQITTCSGYSANNFINLSSSLIYPTNASQNLVGWRTSSDQAPYGVIHPRLIGNFSCTEINANVSNVFPLRPISFDGSVLMYCRGIEIWELPSQDNGTINFIEKVDAWIPVPTFAFGSDRCDGDGGGPGETDNSGPGPGETDNSGPGPGETDDDDDGDVNCPPGQKYQDCEGVLICLPIDCGPCPSDCPPTGGGEEEECKLETEYPVCANAENDCLTVDLNSVGCEICTCCEAVCKQDEFCCDPIVGWDATCVELAQTTPECFSPPPPPPPEIFCPNSPDPSETIDQIIGCWGTRNSKFLESPCAADVFTEGEYFIYSKSYDGIKGSSFTRQSLYGSPCDNYNQNISDVNVHNNERTLNYSERPYPKTNSFWETVSGDLGTITFGEIVDFQVLLEVSQSEANRFYSNMNVCVGGAYASGDFSFLYVYARAWKDCNQWIQLRPNDNDYINLMLSADQEQKNLTYTLPISGSCGMGQAQNFVLNSNPELGGVVYPTGSNYLENPEYVLLRFICFAPTAIRNPFVLTIDSISVNAVGGGIQQAACNFGSIGGSPEPLIDYSRIPGVVDVYTGENETIYTIDFSGRSKPIEISGFPKNRHVPVYDEPLKRWITRYAPIFDTIKEGIVFWDFTTKSWNFGREFDAGTYIEKGKTPQRPPSTDNSTDS